MVFALRWCDCGVMFYTSRLMLGLWLIRNVVAEVFYKSLATDPLAGRRWKALIEIKSIPKMTTNVVAVTLLSY